MAIKVGHFSYLTSQPQACTPHDIRKLIKSFNKLIDLGHTILVIEHNLEVVKQADWIIDLGPEGGDGGGSIVFEGTPEDIVKAKGSFTGQYLNGKI